MSWHTVCAAAAIAVGGWVSCAHAQAPVGNAEYRVAIQTGGGGSVPPPSNVPVSTSFQYTNASGGGIPATFTGNAVTGGGMQPIADIDASGTGTGFLPDTISAQVTYGYRVVPLGTITRPTVPLVVTAFADASITPLADVTLTNANASGTVRVFRPGDTNNPVINGGAFTNVQSGVGQFSGVFSQTVSTVAVTGLAGRVEIRASGFISSSAEINAVADPIFLIDPDATFVENGVVMRYADVFVIEYSPTIEQYVPSPGSAALAAFSGLVVVRRKR